MGIFAPSNSKTAASQLLLLQLPRLLLQLLLLLLACFNNCRVCVCQICQTTAAAAASAAAGMSVSQSGVQTNDGRILGRGHSNQSWPAGAEAEADEADADDAAAHFQLVAKLTNTNPTVRKSVVQTNEGRILDRGRSNQPWPAGAEPEADEAELMMLHYIFSWWQS